MYISRSYLSSVVLEVQDPKIVKEALNPNKSKQLPNLTAGTSTKCNTLRGLSIFSGLQNLNECSKIKVKHCLIISCQKSLTTFYNQYFIESIFLFFLCTVGQARDYTKLVKPNQMSHAPGRVTNCGHRSVLVSNLLYIYMYICLIIFR